MASIIAKVLTELGPELEKQFHYPGLLIRLRSEDIITDEEQQKVEIGATDYDKSRTLMKILTGKPDSALDTILRYFHEDKTLPHVEQLIYESATKHGYFHEQSTSAGIGSKRRRIQILPSKWWPEHKELIKTFVHRTITNGVPLVEHVRDLLQLQEPNARALVARKCVLVGMGGIGKSSTAKWYANTYQDEYDHIIWVDSDGQSLKGSFDRLARKLGVEVYSSDELQHLVYDIYEKLGPARCLFIFDNAETFDGQHGLLKLLPRHELHYALITSRSIFWGNRTEFGQLPTVQLNVFSAKECVDIFTNGLRLSHSSGEKEMLDLGNELGFLPLALQTVVATIQNSIPRYTISSYLCRIRENIDFLVEDQVLNEYEKSVSASLRISLDQIEKQSKIGERKLTLCKAALNMAACAEPDNIPDLLFLHLPNARADEIYDVLDVLVRYSLLTELEREQFTISNYRTFRHSVRTFSMHRLLQYVLIHDMEKNNIAVMAEPILECAEQTLKWNKHMLKIVIHIWSVLRPKLQQSSLLLQLSRFPCVFAYHTGQDYYGIEFLEETRNLFRSLNTDGDFHKFIIEVRLAYAYAEKRKFPAAESVCEDLKRRVEKMVDNITLKDTLMIHVKLLEADIMFKFTMSDKRVSPGLNDMALVMDTYQNVVSHLGCTSYNGSLDAISIYYNLFENYRYYNSTLDSVEAFIRINADYRTMSFKCKVTLNYTVVLRQFGKNQLAGEILMQCVDTMSKTFPEEIDLTFVFCAYEIISLLRSIDRKVIQNCFNCAAVFIKSKNLNSITASPSTNYHCKLFWNICLSYFTYMLKHGHSTEISSSMDEVRFLISGIDWSPDAIVECINCVKCVLRALARLKRFEDVADLSREMLDKVLCVRSPAHDIEIYGEYLRAGLHLNAMYTCALLQLVNQSSSKSIECALTYDGFLLNFIRANISEGHIRYFWSTYEFYDKIFWRFMNKSEEQDSVITETDRARTKTILKNKLPILLELMRISKKFSSNYWLNTYPDITIPIYDSVCYAFVYLGEWNMAKIHWEECLEKTVCRYGADALYSILNVCVGTLYHLTDHSVKIEESKLFMDDIASSMSVFIERIFQSPPAIYCFDRPRNKLLLKWAGVFLSRNNFADERILVSAIRLTNLALNDLWLTLRYDIPEYRVEYIKFVFEQLHLLRATMSQIQERHTMTPQLVRQLQETAQRILKLKFRFIIRGVITNLKQAHTNNFALA